MKTKQEEKSDNINQDFFGKFFNENAVEYLEKSAGSRWFRDLLMMILDKTDKKSIKTIADFGCGIGLKTAMLSGYYEDSEVIGFDFSDIAIKIANKTYSKTNLHYSCQDITKTNYVEKYDMIAAFDVLEHIDDWESVTKKLIMVNNRYMLLSLPVGRMRPYEEYIGHYRNFKRNQIEVFMNSEGYKTVKTFYAGFPFFSPIMRDLTNLFFKNYSEVSANKMGVLSVAMHDVWYFLFRYLSFKNRGDVFLGLFEKNIR